MVSRIRGRVQARKHGRKKGKADGNTEARTGTPSQTPVGVDLRADALTELPRLRPAASAAQRTECAETGGRKRAR